MLLQFRARKAVSWGPGGLARGLEGPGVGVGVVIKRGSGQKGSLKEGKMH